MSEVNQTERTSLGELARLFVELGTIAFGGPAAQGILYGIKPVVIAVVVQALWRLDRSALKTRWLALLGTVVAALTALGANELVVLFGAGVLAGVGRGVARAGVADAAGALRPIAERSWTQPALVHRPEGG